MKTPRFVSPVKLALTGLAVLCSGAFCQGNAQGDTGPASPALALPAKNPSFSPGVRDILKMLDAKVDADVIKAYIKSSSIAFNPTASDIIELKRRGVPDELITAMILRGAEVRTQFAQAAAAQPPVPANPQASMPQGYAYDYPAPAYPYPNYVDYAYGYPYYGAYYGYPWYAGYPYNYWWFNYGYPWGGYYSYWRYGHRFYGYDRYHYYNRFQDYDRFHGGRSFAYGGRAGGGASGAWAPASGNRSIAVRGGYAGHSFGGGGFHGGGFAGRGGGGGFGGHGGGHR